MKLSTFKQHLDNLNSLNFILPNGTFVPKHFHITEAGLVTKHYIDCGGTVRLEKVISFQIWFSNDTEHRLEPTKLLRIIALAENLFGNEDLEIEVEYQSDTIGKYDLDFQGKAFLLKGKQTDCLAKDHCGIPQDIKRNVLEPNQSNCIPGGGCC